MSEPRIELNTLPPEVLRRPARMGGGLLILAGIILLVFGVLTAFGSAYIPDADLRAALPPGTVVSGTAGGDGPSLSFYRTALVVVATLVGMIGLVYLALGFWARRGTTAGTLTGAIANGVVLPVVFIYFCLSLGSAAAAVLFGAMLVVLLGAEFHLIQAYRVALAVRSAIAQQAWMRAAAARAAVSEGASGVLADATTPALLESLPVMAPQPAVVTPAAPTSKPVDGYWPPSGLKK